MSYLLQIEKRINHRIESDFKTTLKTALMTVFLAVSGCGSQDKKSDPSKDKDKDSNEEYDNDYNNTSTYTEESQPLPDRYQEGGTGFHQQMTGRGWVCRIILVNSTTMTWEFIFSIGRMTGTPPAKHDPELRITFKRDSKESAWNLDKPAIDVSQFGSFEPAVNIKDDVLKLIDKGYKAIIDKYDCELNKPDNLRDRF